MFRSSVTVVPIESNDEEFFRKYDEIWSKITELIGINNPHDFVEIDNENVKRYKKIQVLLEINIEMILYLFLHLFLIIYLKHH